MARGDVKTDRSGSRGYSYRIGPRERVNPDAERNQESKYWLDNMSGRLDAEGCAMLKDVDDTTLARAFQAMNNWRYGKHDWNDRFASKVIAHCGGDAWNIVNGRAASVVSAKKAAETAEYEAHQLQWQQNMEVEAAKKLLVTEEQTLHIRQEIEQAAGCLRSDFSQAFSAAESYDIRSGDWLDSPVRSYTAGDGFGEETRRQSGIKLQITVSLDLSNSMWHNKLADTAFEAFRTIYGMLLAFKEEHPQDIFVQGFTFAQGKKGDTCQFAANYNDGVQVYDKDSDLHLGDLEGFRTSRQPWDAGESTMFEPLFEKIEKWENEHSDHGAIKLDLIITDGVAETKADIVRASTIQDRRDGNLQSVFLNFLPESEWSGSSVPFHCVQYAANKDNIVGMLRSLIAEFVQVYL